MSGGVACGVCLWGLRRSPHGATERVRGGHACQHRHWDLRWRSVWGNEACDDVDGADVDDDDDDDDGDEKDDDNED
eukprot:1374579-Pyramimonas_sp.AAC.1